MITYKLSHGINYNHTFSVLVFRHFIHLAYHPQLKHNIREINKLLKNKRFIGIFAYNEKNKIIGYMLGSVDRLSDGRVSFFINYLYVCKKYRKNGIASEMIKLIKIKCNEINVRYILLTCDTSDKKVYNFYLMRQFMPDQQFRTYSRFDTMCANL